jgi:hypothetical protein
LNARSQDFSTGENVPYCASCFSRLHRPVGAGAGSALSASYAGQKDVEQVTQRIGTFTTAAQPEVQKRASKQHSTRKETVQCADLNVVSSIRANSPPPMWTQQGRSTSPPPASSAVPAVRGDTLTEEEKFRGDGDEVDESEWWASDEEQDEQWKWRWSVLAIYYQEGSSEQFFTKNND